MTPTFDLRDPRELLAFIPYLFGFHPVDSLVAVGVRDGTIDVNARADLPRAGAPPGEYHQLVAQLARLVRQQDLTGVILIGYGPEDRATRAVLEMNAALEDTAVEVLDALRVDDGRYWSYLCPDPDCCPPDGKPINPQDTFIAAHQVLAGRVVMSDRQTLLALVAPADEESRAAMRAAVERADQRLAELTGGRIAAGDRGRNGGQPLIGHAATGLTASTAADDQAAERGPWRLLVAGSAALDEALATVADGRVVSDDLGAWLAVLVAFPSVRDLAWSKLAEGPDDLDKHRMLWGDLIRRVDHDLVPATGSLLAMAAWLGGDGTLASAALDRVLAAEPDHGLAHLLIEAIERGLPPAMLAAWAPGTWPVSPSPGRPRRRRSSSRRARSRRG